MGRGIEAVRGKDMARLPGARVPTTRPVHCRRHFGHFIDDRAPPSRPARQAFAPRIAKSNARHRDI
ncbi:hypothetical protein DF027_27760 [Burkholderia cenocepacia]|nr:hypothetical protein DF027_27760 [Burkholderia cenocepacia]RQV37732.1 hypothetical protein DF028_20645 [Burkholderia cenocepacia]RQV70239.1 hypothetical protein DF010_30365 [Burkholderia cenocepacia]